MEHVGAVDAPGMARYDAAPALRLWLSHVNRTLPIGLPHMEGPLKPVACALHVLGALLPGQLNLEDILMGCFLSWTGMGADDQEVFSAL